MTRGQIIKRLRELRRCEQGATSYGLPADTVKQEIRRLQDELYALEDTPERQRRREAETALVEAQERREKAEREHFLRVQRAQLRDEFAKAALPALMVDPAFTKRSMEELAVAAYVLADEMLKARELELEPGTDD